MDEPPQAIRGCRFMTGKRSNEIRTWSELRQSREQGIGSRE
jgi:hypothetical protein